MTIASRWIPKMSAQAWLRLVFGVALVGLFFFNEAEIYQVRFLQQLEFWAYDARLRLFLPNQSDKRVAILDIDEKSLNAEGRWPWSRDKVALMVRQAFDKYGVRTMGFDIAFAEKDNSSGLSSLEELGRGPLRDEPRFQSFLQDARSTLDYDKVLADEIGKHPVVLGFFMGGKTDKSGVLPPPAFTAETIAGPKKLQFPHYEATGYSGNIAELQKQATHSGHLYPAIDFDGTTRRVPLFVSYGNGYYPAMSLALVQVALNNAPMVTRGEEVEPGIGNLYAARVGDLTIPMDDRMSVLVPYRGPRGSFEYVSATEVIRGTLPADALKDRIVIVGTSAQGLLDLRSTPVQEDFPGVEVHANLVAGFLDQSIMHRPEFIRTVSILTVLLLGLPLALLLPRFSALIGTIAVASIGVLLIAMNLFAWSHFHYVLNIATPLALVLSLYLLNMAWGFFMETRSRRLISGLFGTYVPKELVAQMSKNPEEFSMRGESRNMTVLFSDVRDFTSISEGLQADELRELMNAYLSEMTVTIQETRGTIDKYIGDAIMAFWGAPLHDDNHAANGVAAALAMQKRVRALDTPFAKKGWPMLNIGVGLNCGEMNVGDMGSSFRRAYTVMGDAVNIASRLESLTKEYGAGILVSENIVQAAQGFVYREMDLVAVKGRTTGIPIFEPVGKVGEVGETTLAEIEKWHRALEYYRKQRWDEAQEMLKNLSYAAPETKLYKLYLKRIDFWRANTPGPVWKGLWTWTTK